MKTNKWTFKKGKLPFVVLLITTLFATTSCRDLLEDKSPGWLGESIYTNLKNSGRFENTTRLIDDLNYKAVLDKTGSKTLFVASDAAYNRFYAQNDWGVRKYEDLSRAQKNWLLFGAMINNSYTMNMFSSATSGAGTLTPTLGSAMRRNTSVSIYDSLQIMNPEEMPATKYWNNFINRDKSIYCMKDGTASPMVYFIEKQLINNTVIGTDIDVIMNQPEGTRQPNDVYVNGLKLVNKNQKCANGFVHEVADVMRPLKNMAEIIRTNPTFSLYSSFLERFSAPYADMGLTSAYNSRFGTQIDTIYRKRYFSERTQSTSLPTGSSNFDFRTYDGTGTLTIGPDKGAVSGILKFDPGWSSYLPLLEGSVSNAIALQRDIAAMFVPSNEALMEYFDNGPGKALKDYYMPSGWPAGDNTWVNAIPDDVVARLLNNNMMNSFLGSVPSKFAGILDDASYNMGVKKEDVDSAFVACNGVIYKTNKVYSPTSFISVSFPVFVDKRMSAFNWAINQLKFNAYLNSKESYYSFFVPTNGALQYYVDPVSYGRTTTRIFKFSDNPNPTATDGSDRILAEIWEYNDTTNQVGDYIGMASNGQVLDRLKDMLENHTVIGDVTDGNTYYMTKGGSTIKVNRVADGVNGMTVSGSRQIDEGNEIPISRIYTQVNGKVYIMDRDTVNNTGEPIMSARKSAYDVMTEHPEFSKFAELLSRTGFLTSTINGHSMASANNFGFFSKYHYTIYVPSNDSIVALQNRGLLPTWDQVDSLYDAATTEDTLTAISKTKIIQNFVKYHVQDNSIFLDKRDVSGVFETALMNLKDKVFYTLNVKAGSGFGDKYEVSYNVIKKDVNGNPILDAFNNKQILKTVTRHVTSNPNLRNLMAREFMYDSGDALNANTIFSSANVVIHQIDGALLYDEEFQFK